MKKENKKIQLLILVFTIFLVSIIVNAKEKTSFLEVGNIKVVRSILLKMKKENLKIIIKKNKTIEIESEYLFENVDKYNIKSTFMFWLNQNVINNNPNRYIDNIKFESEYKKIKNLRAVINFNEDEEKDIISEENDAKNKKDKINEKIQREWFAITKTIEAGKIGRLVVNYNLKNTNFENTKKFKYDFSLVSNFLDKNKIERLDIIVLNESDYKIKEINYKGNQFNKRLNKNKDEQFEAYLGDLELDSKLEINFE